jgi:outer membrane immunogenic protein
MKSYLVFAAVCGLAMPAVAGGPIEPVVEPVPVAEAPAPDFDWTGFYAGLGVGRGSASDDGGLTETDTDPVGLQFGYLRDLGTFVLGGELAYVQGGYDDFPDQEWDSTRLKLLGGFDAGRFLPYAFLGLSNYDVDNGAVSDTVPIYGLGARYAAGASGRLVFGLEYLVENKDDFDDSGFDLESDDLSLRVDFRF